MTVNNSFLLGLFSKSSTSSTNIFSALYPTPASTNLPASTSKSSTPPTPPWYTAQASQSALVQQALAGQPFINTSSAKLSVVGTNASVNQDYKNLFALYQGLNTLYALSQQATASNNTNLQQTELRQAFNSGVGQVESFLQGGNFKNLTLVQGSVATQETSASSVSLGSATYVGQNIVQDSSSTDAPAFDGDVQFSMTVTDGGGAQKTIAFNLADMGTTTRSLANVLSYLNDQLAAAGVKTRFATQRTPGQAETTQVGSKTVTLGTSPDQWALTVVGAPTETVSLSAPATADAVYVAQGSGASGSAGQQLLKFQTDTTQGSAPPPAQALPGETHVTAGEAWEDNLPSTVSGVQATAAGPDGSVYVLADVNGKTSGQILQGASDVALMKYDSAGNLVFTQTLGASQSASGYGLAVSADGEVAVTGSVTGSLNPGDGLTSGETSAFVNVYDTSGNQLWSQTVAPVTGVGNAQGNAVAFGAGDSVYLVGQSDAPLAGGGSATGSTNGFVAGFSSTGTKQFLTQYGATGTNRATAVTVDGNSVLVGGVENGSAVVRSYDISSPTAPALTAQRNLGFLQGGSVAGIALNNGQLIVAGTTSNTGLSAGTTTAAGGTGSNAFVAALDPGLQSSSSDSIAYYQDQGSTTATAVTVANGQVYIAGAAGPTITVAGSGVTSSGQTTTPQTGQAGYIAQIDPTTGQIGFSTSLEGADGIAAPTSIAVSTGGASVLDRLGLPTGTISQTGNSDLLTTATSVQAGDYFYLQGIAGQPPVKVTVQADDTWKTLAARIQQASNFRISATVNTTATSQTLVLKAADPDASAQILAGPAGKNALTSLGLTPGLIQPSASKSSSSSSSSKASSTTFGLNLSATLDVNTATDAKHAGAQLLAAMAVVKSAYQALVSANAPKSAATQTSSKPIPAYLTAQISNYAAALARLTGG